MNKGVHFGTRLGSCVKSR